MLSMNEPAIRFASALLSAVLTFNVLSLPTGNKTDVDIGIGPPRQRPVENDVSYVRIVSGLRTTG